MYMEYGTNSPLFLHYLSSWPSKLQETSRDREETCTTGEEEGEEGLGDDAIRARQFSLHDFWIGYDRLRE